MSKRRADIQIHPTAMDDDEDERYKIDPVKKADAATLATRKYVSYEREEGSNEASPEL